MSPQIIFLLNKSLESIRNFHFDSAELYLKQVLRLQSKNSEALRLLGVIYAQQKKSSEAIDYFNLSLKASPKNSITHSNLGNVFFELKEYEKALNSYDKAILINPKYEEVWSNKGNTLQEMDRFDEALLCHNKAIELKPDYAEAWSNKGNVLHELERLEEALLCHNKAIELKPDYAEAWSNRGSVLHKLNQFDEALLSQAESIRLKPTHTEAWLGKGMAFFGLNLFDAASTCYSTAIELKPDYAEAWGNKGASLHECKLYEEAIIAFDHAIALKPNYAEPWSNKAASLRELRRYEESLAHFEKALVLKSDIDWMYGNYLATKTAICNWDNIDKILGNLAYGINSDQTISVPFSILGSLDDPQLQRKVSEIYINTKYPPKASLGPIQKYERKEKIKIGYFSAEFHSHATTYLMAELFELHNKDQFEVIAFSFGPNIIDAMRERLVASFDQFIDVRHRSDLEIAQLSRELKIDIAIDLKGFTFGGRTGIFSHRAAPIQVNYLGYPGTMGADYIDYLIADRVLIPQENQKYYSEKIAYLPYSYQVNDSNRLISEKLYTREELGLPKDGFVFCCFNNNYKILPNIFDSWMNILKEVDGSVLWLLADNPSVIVNLKNEAIKRMVNPNRLVFAERVSLPDHLARHQCADLFLDTVPCNAHTTASDALWAKLPVLTLIGQSFSSRVAASLLNAIEVSELITYSQEEYEALAIELAMNPSKLGELKNKLTKNRLSTPLFNTPLFTGHIESAYSKMYERYQSNLAPDHIYF